MERLLKESKRFVLGSCQCGCGTSINVQSGAWLLKRFVWGHNGRADGLKTQFKKDKTKAQHGTANPNWRGGRFKDKNGYWYVLYREHHFADNGYVLEHRLVWEYHNKAVLLPWAVIHHINQIRTDNRIENLQLTNRREHIQIHVRLRHQR